MNVGAGVCPDKPIIISRGQIILLEPKTIFLKKITLELNIIRKLLQLIIINRYKAVMFILGTSRKEFGVNNLGALPEYELIHGLKSITTKSRSAPIRWANARTSRPKP